MKFNIEINKIYNMDCLEGLGLLDDNYIDLTVTSPPYDNLRTYNGYSFDFENVAKELYRVTKEGGVVVWIVGDKTINGSESGTSFKQALFFKQIGFNIHDTMIYAKNNVYAHDPRNKRYKQAFEYMFVFSKGKPKTYNEIRDKPVKNAGKKLHGTKGRTKEGVKRELKSVTMSDFQARFNIWTYTTGRCVSKDAIAFKHPAIFPEKLAEDHIKSWSNEGDIVLDPFMGSGTTAKMAMLNNRKYIGFECSKEYCEIADKRIKTYIMKEGVRKVMPLSEDDIYIGKNLYCCCGYDCGNTYIVITNIYEKDNAELFDIKDNKTGEVKSVNIKFLYEYSDY